MKFNNFFYVFLFLTLFVFNIFSEDTARLVIGVTPWGDRVEMNNFYKPFVDYVSEKMQIPVSLYIAGSYSDLGDKLDDGEVHFGIFSPTAYVLAKNRNSKIKYIATTVKNDSPYYYGYIIARKDSKIKKIKNLKGKKFCFTDKTSTSGYKYPMLIFKKNKISAEKFFKEIIFVKTHDDSLEAVYNGIVDAGAVSGAFENYIYRDKLIAIDKTPPIPLDAVVANGFMDQKSINLFKKIILSLNKDTKNKDGALILEKLYFQGFVEKDDHFYDVVRDMLNEFGE